MIAVVNTTIPPLKAPAPFGILGQAISNKVVFSSSLTVRVSNEEIVVKTVWHVA